MRSATPTGASASGISLVPASSVVAAAGVLAASSCVARSCGYGVPRMAFEVERRELTEWGEKKGSEGVARYWRDKNARSIDGLPGV